jgi:UDP-glucose 4-epimerase
VTRTVVVTGARGFVGAATIRKLATVPDTRVIAIVRSRPRRAEPNVRWIESSLEELTRSHWAALESSTVDVLLHVAAFTPKVAAERDQAEAIIRSNVVGTQRLLASLPQAPRRLVFCSTLDVYARSAFDGIIDERSPTAPVGLYGVSKLFGEELAAAYARSAGTEHVALRLSHVYGPGEERYGKLVPETIRRVLAGKAPRIAGDGGESRDLIYVEDVAEALVRSCAVPLGAVTTINIARGESYPVRDVAATIAELAGYGGPVEQSVPPADSYSTVFDTSLMTRVLGIWPLVPLRQGLTNEIAYFRDLVART